MQVFMHSARDSNGRFRNATDGFVGRHFSLCCELQRLAMRAFGSFPRNAICRFSVGAVAKPFLPTQRRGGARGGERGHVLLAHHPLTFAVGVAVYLGLFLILVQLLSVRLAIFITFALSVGHAIGGAGWLVREGIVGCLLALCFIVAAERLVGTCWRKSGLAAANA